MTYKVLVMPRASKDIDALSRPDRERIVARIIALNNLEGDVKRLTQHSPEYRLRVGDYRILFDIENDKVVVYRVMRRSKAYKG